MFGAVPRRKFFWGEGFGEQRGVEAAARRRRLESAVDVHSKEENVYTSVVWDGC